jgi:hypothetical protein
LRHVVVEQDEVGLQFGYALQRFCAIAGLADHGKVVLQFQQLAHAAPHQGVIIDQQDGVLARFAHVMSSFSFRLRNSGRNAR